MHVGKARSEAGGTSPAMRQALTQRQPPQALALLGVVGLWLAVVALIVRAAALAPDLMPARCS